MPTREIKTRFKLEGENEFKRAMSDAASAVKVLNSEEKLAKAQYEATGDAQQYAADQARILKEQIEFQKKAVQAAEEAIKKLTENGVDKNASQVKKWQLKLNSAKTALLNMQNRLDKVGTELGEEDTAFRNALSAGTDFQTGMENVAKGIDLSNAVTAIDNVTDHIETIVRTAAKAAKAMWEMGIEGSVWADNLSTAAKDAGLDVETYQSWQYASKFIDTSVDTIVANWRDIDSKMAQEGDALRDYMVILNEAGVAAMDANGKRLGKDIFWDLIDHLHSINDEGERTRQALTLFGNDWRKLSSLIDAGSGAYKDLAEEGRAVAVVSEKEVAQLGLMNDQYEDLQSRLTKFKMDSLAALAPTFNQVAEALSTAVTAMDEFVQSEEGQAALGELNEAVSGLIGAFLGEDNGQETFAGIVNAAKEAVTGLTTALDWISQNGGVVKGIIEGLGIAWAGLTVTKEVLTFVMLLRALPLNKLSALMSGGKSLSSGTSTGIPKTSGTGTGFFKNAANWGKETLASIGPFLTDLAIGAGSQLGVLAAGILPAYLDENAMRAADTARLEGTRAMVNDAILTMGDEVSDTARAAADAVNMAADSLGESKERFEAVTGRGVWGDPAAVSDTLDAIASFTDEQLGFLDPQTRLRLRYNQKNGLVGQEQSDLLEDILTQGSNFALNGPVAEKVTDALDAIDKAMGEIISVQEALDEGFSPENEQSMYDLIRNISNDQDLLDSLSDATKALIAQWLDPTSGYGNGSAGIFTDSQELLDLIFGDLGDAYDQAVGLGKDIDVGLANGIYDSADVATKAANDLARQIASQFSQVLMIHSPSQVFKGYGLNVGEGLAEGINESVSAVERATNRMVGATMEKQVKSRSISLVGPDGLPLSGYAAGSGNVHVTLEVDKDVLGDVTAPLVNERIGAKINATRRN